jgi:replicative DNA helicase
MKSGLHYSPDLELAVIGACLMEKSAVSRIYGVIESKHFYQEDHQKIFGALLEMHNQSIPIDLITAECFMMSKGIELHNCNQYGNYAYYLASTTNKVVSTAHLEYHSHILREMWKIRELERLTQSGIDPTEDTAKQITELNEQLNEIRGSEFKKEWTDMSELMVGLIKHQEEIKSGAKVFLSSGFKGIDRLNGGFWEGQFIVIGARPSMGKSALIGKMAMHMAKQGKKVGIISLEMNNNEVAARLGSLDSEFDFSVLFRNLFEDQKQHERFYTLAAQMANLPIYISDKTGVDINEIKAKAVKLKYQVGCDCLIIDYLQLVDTYRSNKNTNREQEVSKISRGLKLLGLEMNIPIIAVCQLNRDVTKRGYKDRFPRESDLRESGSLEQDADAILMLHRDFKAGFETDPNTGGTTEFEADLLGVKWRNGATFHLKLDFEPKKMKFSEQKGFTPVQYHTTPDITEPSKNEMPF